jgi:hypothetical protein
MKHLKFCQERADLLNVLNEATLYYSKAAQDLSVNAEAMSISDYRARHLEAGHIRARIVSARAAFADHRQQHDC